MAADGHLDCMFDCGLKFSTLEALYLHIELDHREDNSVSPFAVQEVADAPALRQHAETNELQPRSNGTRSDTNGRSESFTHHGGPFEGSRDGAEGDQAFVLCPEKDCGELILVSDLNDHLDIHDAQQASLDEDSSSSSASSLALSRPTNVYPSASSATHSAAMDRSSSSSSDRQANHGSTKRKDRDTASEDSRTHIGRKFLTMLKDKRPRDRYPSNKAPGTQQRLGKAELGPYAFEKQMPSWMLKRLREGPKISKTRRISRNGGLVTHETVDGQVNGVLPILRQLVDLDSAVNKAYLCHPSVTQVGKRSWETGFCGYHNTQMSISYIQNSKHAAHTLFPEYIPGILDIQDWIEAAWDEGINVHARVEFGGLKDTRKWIGTLEVNTLFEYLGIPHRTRQFHDTLEDNNQYADQNLLDFVEEYFRQGVLEDGRKVQCTLKPPIYFQRPGHSLTIVGVEKMKDGTRNLLVFDPMFQVSTAMLQLIERGRVRETNGKLLRNYRRSQNRLYHYADFEITMLEGDLPLFPAWDIVLDHDLHGDQFVTVTDWNWQTHSLENFLPDFPWHLYGTVFRMEEARFLPPAMPMLLNLCTPQLWFRTVQRPTPAYEQWMILRSGCRPAILPA